MVDVKEQILTTWTTGVTIPLGNDYSQLFSETKTFPKSKLYRELTMNALYR